ncbi:hypothetical protein MIR68_010728 [Amoeboaphelidium protococcarum]|nr:hypothetical protein MIR68_010728 [Amoeboaphelidium protococcarum]
MVVASRKQQQQQSAVDNKKAQSSKSLAKQSVVSEAVADDNTVPVAEWYEPIIDNGYIPDFVLRPLVRTLLGYRTSVVNAATQEDVCENRMQFVKQLKSSKVALNTKEANEQHYEVPSEFIQMCLGQRLKYSCCLFPTQKGGKNVVVVNDGDLDAAEDRMLATYCDKAQLVDGQSVLDLGCGWGSLSLYLAEKYPKSKITGLSNSKTQKQHIDSVAKSKGFKNLTIITADVNEFDTSQKQFDRIVSIEMLEHMKNYQQLFTKISSWLKDEGLFFCHIFCHKSWPYHFKVDERHSWMARNFFTGGTMPSADLFLYFQDSMTLVDQWIVNGMHYAHTSENWLSLMDKNKAKALDVLKKSQLEYLSSKNGDNAEKLSPQDLDKKASDEAYKWFVKWRIFYISVAELFAYNQGEEWYVSHYLFQKKTKN